MDVAGSFWHSEFVDNPTVAAALIIVTVGALMAISALFSRPAARAGIPVALIFIALGMIAGSEGLGGLSFEDYDLAFKIGSAGLALILFDGGLNTPLSALKETLKPSLTLATVGVVLTAAVLAGIVHLLGLSVGHSLLLGSIVASTDAAAVFAILRGSGVHLKKRVGATLEVESGINDPLAVILTVTAADVLAGRGEVGWMTLAGVGWQIAVGGGAGVVIGIVGRQVMRRARLPSGLNSVLSTGIALLAFALPSLVDASGFLCVYVAAIVIGNAELPHKSGLLRIHDALAWLSQVAVFLLLGLLVFPSRLGEVAWFGVAAGIALTFVARPLAVLLCLLPFRYSMKEIGYVGWIGLRGAVPVILATYPVLTGVPGAVRIFDIVFFIVLLNSIVPGTTVKWVTRLFGLAAKTPPPPEAVLEINASRPVEGEMISFFIRSASAACGAQIADLPFPEHSVAALIVRGQKLIAPKGPTVLQPGDHVYVITQPEDRALLTLVFGQEEEHD